MKLRLPKRYKRAGNRGMKVAREGGRTALSRVNHGFLFGLPCNCFSNNGPAGDENLNVRNPKIKGRNLQEQREMLSF